GTGRWSGASISLVHQDQIQIAVITHLPAAQFAECQQGVAARLAIACSLAEMRNAKTSCQRRLLEKGDLNQQRLGQVAQGSGRPLNRIFSQDVADADPKQLLVLKTVQNRVRIRGAATEVSQLVT